MGNLLLKNRLYLTFHNRITNMQYLSKLPVETRFVLRYSLFPYNWRYLSCWYKNIAHTVSSVLPISTKNQISKDSWDLYTSTSLWILPRLRCLKSNLHGFPCNIEDDFSLRSLQIKSVGTLDEESETRDTILFAKWQEILSCIIYAFEYPLLLDIRYNGIRGDSEQSRADYAKYQAGMALFAKHYTALWD